MRKDSLKNKTVTLIKVVAFTMYMHVPLKGGQVHVQPLALV